MRRKILITGATGKQGQALIRALLQAQPASSPNPEHTYHISALSRSPTSPAAQSLFSSYSASDLTLVQGDLDDRASMTAIFEEAKFHNDPFWGVFAVLAFPGLGANADGEERQGKMIADLALQYGVEAFVYSSAMRAGPKFEGMLEGKLSAIAKRNVEIYCRELGERGLPWV